MIIFLYGRDSFRLKQNLDKILVEYQKKNPSGLSHNVFDLVEYGQFEKLENVLKPVTFFNEKKLIILKSAFTSAEALTALIKKWDLISDKETILVATENLSAPELNKKDKTFFKLLTAKPNLASESEPLVGKSLENWVVKEATKLAIQLEPQVTRKLIDYITPPRRNFSPKSGESDDQTGLAWRLDLELLKLANFAVATDRRQIEVGDIERLVTPRINLNIFDTIDAIANRNKAQGVILLAKHLEAGDDPYYLLSMLTYQFRNLLRVKDLVANNASAVLTASAIVKKTGLHPFVVGKLMQQVKKFELDELKYKFSEIAESDIKIKNGVVDIVDFLYQFALA